MAKVKILNISRHSPAGEVIEVEEAKAKTLVEAKRAVYYDETIKKDAVKSKSLKKVTG